MLAHNSISVCRKCLIILLVQPFSDRTANFTLQVFYHTLVKATVYTLQLSVGGIFYTWLYQINATPFNQWSNWMKPDEQYLHFELYGSLRAQMYSIRRHYQTYQISLPNTKHSLPNTEQYVLLKGKILTGEEQYIIYPLTMGYILY